MVPQVNGTFVIIMKNKRLAGSVHYSSFPVRYKSLLVLQVDERVGSEFHFHFNWQSFKLNIGIPNYL